MEIHVFIPETTSLVTPLAVPHVGISMLELGFGMAGMSLFALGLAIVEKRYPESELVKNISKSFTATIPVIGLVIIGWFFWKITGMFAPLTMW